MVNPFINPLEGRFRSGMRILFYFMLVTLGLGALMMATAAARSAPLLRWSLGPVVLGCTVLAARSIDRRPLGHFGLSASRKWRAQAAAGLGLGAILMGLAFLAALLAGSASLKGVPGPGFGIITLVDAFLTFLSLALREEIMFRGYLMRNLAEGLAFPRLGKRGAALLSWALSALAFALVRMGNPGSGAASLLVHLALGLFLGLPVLLTGSIAFSVGLNLGWSFSMGAIFGFPVSGVDYATSLLDSRHSGAAAWLSGGAFGPEGGLLGLGAALIGAAAVCLWQRRKTGRPFDAAAFLEAGEPSAPAPSSAA